MRDRQSTAVGTIDTKNWKMKYSVIGLISMLLLSKEIIAGNNTGREKHSNLKITFEGSFSIKLLDSVSLISNGIYLETNLEYEKQTKSFNCNWKNLPGGKYVFKIKTVFEKIELRTFRLTHDTSIVISNIYELINFNNLVKAGFTKADSIRIYFRSSGCFHDFKQKITLRKSGDENYRLTYCYDTTAYERVNGGLKVVEIPVFYSKNVNAGIIDSLFKLVNDSQIQQKKILETGHGCTSTTHEYLYILIYNSLFQFNNSGLCNWNLYSDFKKEFINEFE
jgi:hypothetical protein